MIICSCTMLSDRDIEGALIEIFSAPNALIPTPGVVFRQLRKKMACCGCAPLAVSTIYKTVERLEREQRVCPYTSAAAKSKLIKLEQRRERRQSFKALRKVAA